MSRFSLIAVLGLVPALGSGAPAPDAPAAAARAVLAGGCFWCMEAPFDTLPGVQTTTSGYMGGRSRNPTYEQVSTGATGHAEAVQVVYDPARITYGQLLDVFWKNVDPFDKGGQFCDRGGQYRSAIFYGSEEERRLAEESKRHVEQRFGRKVATEIVPASDFYAAEEYHQDFYRKNPARYQSYRRGCRRDLRLKELWGDKAGGHGGGSR